MTSFAYLGMLAALALPGLTAFSPALGQSAPAPEAPAAIAPHAPSTGAAFSPPSAPYTPYTDAELESFAGAAMILQRINDDVVPKLRAASTLEEQHELVQAASTEMTQALARKGLSVHKFQEILSQAQTHPGIAEKVARHIENIRH